MNLFEKMAAITADMETVAKNLTVETVKGRGYKAVSERDIIDAVKPLEAKHRVYSFPASRELVESEILESESTYEGKTTKKTTFYTHLKTVYRFVDVDAPESFIDMTVYSVGLDSQDKGDGKAMTYGDKYALMKAYKISTGDDPDQEASTDNDYRPQRAAQRAPAQRGNSAPVPKPAAQQAQPQATAGLMCSECGAPISDREYDFSMRMFGHALCRKCQTQANAGR